MAENFILSYLNKKEKIDDTVFDYGELEDKFISTFGLSEEIKNHLQFYLDGKEITKNDDLMEIIKPDNVIEVKNLMDEDKPEVEETKLEEKVVNNNEVSESKEIILENKDESNNQNNFNPEEFSKNFETLLSQKLEENNQKIEKIILEKNEEKVENLKKEIIDIVEQKIKSLSSENNIEQKILDFDNKLSKLEQDYTNYKSIKIKYFDKFIEFLDNKGKENDSIKKDETDSSQKSEDIENMKEKNNKLKEMIKKLKKEKDDLKDKLEKEKMKTSPEFDNLKIENEKLLEEKNNLLTKIKNLESEIKKKNEKPEVKSSISPMSSKSITKKYSCKLNTEKKDFIYQYDEVKEEGSIELILNIKNNGEEELPKNCELILMNSIVGLNLEKNFTKSPIKESEQMIIHFKVDLESIQFNEDIDVKLKLCDDKKKDIDGAKCKVKVKIIKEDKDPEPEDNTKNSNTLEENEYKELYDYVNEILSIETIGENISSFKEKVNQLLEDKKDKYESITERTEYIDSLKEDLLEIFQ